MVLAVPLCVGAISHATAAPERNDDVVSIDGARTHKASEPLVLQPSVAARPKKKATATGAPAAPVEPGGAPAARAEAAVPAAEAAALPSETAPAAKVAVQKKPSAKPGASATVRRGASPPSAAGAKVGVVQGLNPGPVLTSAAATQAAEKTQPPAPPVAPPVADAASATQPQPVSVQPAAAESPAAPKPAAPTKAAVAPPPSPDIQQYCTNIAPLAAEAEGAWQARKLLELDGQLKARIAELEAKRIEYKEWLEKREEFVKKAEEGLVAIYSRMRPDAAASQIAVMEDGTAAAVLARLNARTASAILNEMPPGRAARLTSHMAGATARDGKKS